MVKRYISKKKKSNIIFYIDKSGNKRWKWRNSKGAIYGR